MVTGDIQQRIEDLEAARARLLQQYHECASEVTLFPGRSSDDLRDNWRREEDRRSALRSLDQSIIGIDQELARLRS